MLFRIRTLCFCFLLVFLMASDCPGPVKDAGPDSVKSSWKPAFDTTEAGSVSGIWGSGAADIWAVGGIENAYNFEVGTVFHYDGDLWKKVAAPEIDFLVWVHGTGPNDIWMVGKGGAVLHYDGAGFTQLDANTTGPLWGVFARDVDDVFMVGEDEVAGTPILLHYDGVDFARTMIDNTNNPNNSPALYKVWGIGQKLFAVGARGLILEQVNNVWEYRPAGPEANEDFVSLWGTSENNMMAVGGRSGGKIAEYDGQTWSTISPSGYGGLNAVFMVSESTAFVGGTEGFLGQYDVDGNTLVQEDSGTRREIHAIWADGTRVYAVGGGFAIPHRGVVLVRNY